MIYIKNILNVLLLIVCFALASQAQSITGDAYGNNTDGSISQEGSDAKNSNARLLTTGPAKIDVFPVRGKHNTGYDRATDCAPSSWNCDNDHSNSDFIPSGSEKHLGVDIWAARGTPVAATVNGTLTLVGWSDYSGNKVTVKTSTGWYHFFCHLNSIASGMVNGRTVRAGDIIGYVGNTGSAARGTIHLHYGLYPDGDIEDAINPGALLKAVENNVCDDACPASRNFTSTINSGTYKSSGTITASAGLASGADVVFDAKSSVTLNIGFSASYANSGSFTAKLGGCSSSDRMSNEESFSDMNVELDDAPSDKNLSIYPNPSKDEVKLSFTLTKPAKVNIRIFNNMGKQVDAPALYKQFEAGNHSILWNTDKQYTNGIYYFTFENNESTVTKKLLIQQ